MACLALVVSGPMANSQVALSRQCLAEFIGTFLLILIGDGAVAVAVFTGAYDLWGAAMLWGLAVVLAVYSMASLSGGHYNPAVTLSLACFRQFPARKIAPYVACQVAGAFAAAGTLYAWWRGFWQPAAARLGVTIGGPGSQKLAMVFSCYYPNPGIVGTTPADWAKVSTGTAFLVEFVLTALLLIVILAVTDASSGVAPAANLWPWFVGLAVAAIVGIGAPLTMDAVNPARDLGPRLWAYLVGFGPIAFPGPRGDEWWLYILAPVAGGLAGSGVYDLSTGRILRRGLSR